MITVRLPSMLQAGTGDTLVVSEPVRTLGDLVAVLERRMPGFRDRLADAACNFAVNDQVVLYHAMQRALSDGDVVEFVPAISGG